MNQEKIIQAIADVINKKGTDDFGMLPWCKPSDLIAELAAAIAPHLEAESGWEDAPSWANWKARDKYGAINYFEEEPVMSDEEWYGGKYQQCGEIPYWTNTLEQRPK